MFNFAGITHVIENPSGHAPGYTFSLVGSVPVSMMEARVPSTGDIMGGRVQADGFAYAGRKWETVESILQAAQEHHVNMCKAAVTSLRVMQSGEKTDDTGIHSVGPNQRGSATGAHCAHGGVARGCLPEE